MICCYSKWNILRIMLPLYVQFLEKVFNGEKKSSLQLYSPSVASFKDIFMSVNTFTVPERI